MIAFHARIFHKGFLSSLTSVKTRPAPPRHVRTIANDSRRSSPCAKS
ncbi:hypothetical protein PY32053_01002 [Paracoccus yeei]|uniref:Uncharacterized protein n=1 Tax=Paracoccus yeei TaxID=147645 RepID=A0A386UJD2_9RHOB|nr:hypothetical protein PY32053_01002 [Paracoccus yeei]